MLIRAVISIMFLVAACVKVADPDAFGVVVWRLAGEGISPMQAVVLGGLLAGAEFGLALAILLDRQTRVWLVGAVVLLLAFTGALVRLAMMADPPSCGCMSIPHPGGSRVELIAGIGRNVGLAWLILIVLARKGDHPAPTPRAAHRVAGFTLVEVLVVIVVIAVLLGIALPVFGRARLASKLHERSVIDRQVHLALEMYVDDSMSAYPYFATPGEPFGSVVINGHTFDPGHYFLAQRWYWASVLVPDYIPDRGVIEAGDRAAQLEDRGLKDLVTAHAQLTSTVTVDPAYLRPESVGRPLNPDHFRGGRRPQLTFPSHKVILASFYGGPGGDERRIAERGGYPLVFGDGSLRVMSEGEINEMPSLERPVLGNISIHGTLGGLSGRDANP